MTFIAAAPLLFAAAGCSPDSAALTKAKADAEAAKAALAKAEAELLTIKAKLKAPERHQLDQQRAAMAGAFNRNDPQGWAAVYAADAEFVEETGEVIRGAEAIQKSLAKLFAENRGIQAQAFVTSERFVAPEVMVEDGSFQVSGLKGGGKREGRYITVWVHRDGQWRLVSHRNWIPTKQPAP
jgi:uncharacterized protein (TIGR02246 family)